MESRSDVDVRLVAVIGLVSAILLVVTVVGLEAYFYNVEQDEVYRKDISQPRWELSDLILQQKAELSSYRWVDQSKQIVAIPISRAKELLVQRQAASRPTG